MKILTCNNIPICVSDSIDLLIKRKDELIDKLKNDDTLVILSIRENSVTYHKGMSYISDYYQIEDIEVLN